MSLTAAAIQAAKPREKPYKLIADKTDPSVVKADRKGEMDFRTAPIPGTG
jgi:hypothetical protein